MSQLHSREQVNINITQLKEAVYKSIADWNKEYQELKLECQKISEFQNTITKDSDRLLEWLNFSSNIYRAISKLSFYAQMENSRNTLNSEIALLLSQAVVMILLMF